MILKIPTNDNNNLLIVLFIYTITFTICDSPRQNQPYCAGPQAEIRAKIVAQGDY